MTDQTATQPGETGSENGREIHVAPARYIYRRAHIADPQFPADGGNGHTICGMPMPPDELWQPVENPQIICGNCRRGNGETRQQVMTAVETEAGHG